MRPVNLLPEESRGRGDATGDPLLSYGIIGALGLLLVMVLFTISQSNKTTTLQDETADLEAQAAKYQVKAAPVQKFNDFGSEVDKRTLIIGGLESSRFPWHTALLNLSQSVPADVTIDTIGAESATAGESGAAAAADPSKAAEEKPSAIITIAGCSTGWASYARFASRLKAMPGVLSVSVKNSGSNDTGGSSSAPAGDSGVSGVDETARHKNCGKNPLTFSVGIEYREIPVDLVGLPKIAAAAGASGATGATPAPSAATGAPAAATTGAN